MYFEHVCMHFGNQRQANYTQSTKTKWQCSSLGLAELAARKYKSAAKNFLQASFDNCECPEVSAMNLSLNSPLIS